MTANIKILKFINNEEILAEIESEDDTHYVLVNTVSVAIVRGPDGRPNVGFAPFPLHAVQTPGSTPPIVVAKKHVLYYYEPAEDFLNNYNQIFGAGIVIPNKQIITG